jgi:hypothetical protein
LKLWLTTPSISALDRDMMSRTRTLRFWARSSASTASFDRRFQVMMWISWRRGVALIDFTILLKIARLVPEEPRGLLNVTPAFGVNRLAASAGAAVVAT